jgi:hypothetical protein
MNTSAIRPSQCRTTEILNGWSKQYVAADQRFASRRPDVLTWQTEVLDKDVTLAGPLKPIYLSASPAPMPILWSS